jgi:hypothetical protein
MGANHAVNRAPSRVDRGPSKGRLAAPLSAVLSILAACALATPTLAQDKPPTAPETKPAQAINAPKTTLLSAGAEPRTALRITPKVGQKQTVDMTMKFHLTTSVDGNAMPAEAVPTMTMTMDCTVTRVDEDGAMRYEFVLSSAGVAPGVEGAGDATAREKTAAALKSIVGLLGSAESTARGVVTSCDVRSPAGATPEMAAVVQNLRQSLAQMSLPLPEEPIGPGGQWKTDWTLNSGGLAMTQTAVYTLEGVQGRVAKTSVKLTQNAAPQDLASPNPKVSTKLKAMSGMGEGYVNFGLDRPIPLSSEVTMKATMSMDATSAGITKAVEQTIDTTVTIKDVTR